MAFKKDKKEEEDGGNPFQNLDKTAVLQETRTFNDTPLNPRKCNHILTKMLYLLYQGEQFGVLEATDAFFAMTKLFQSKDIMLRRMVYLAIKELSKVAEDVIIVTSSLTKDMTGREDLYRAAAIRALCSITDATMLQAIERYMKQAVVDKTPSVSSGAIVSSLHLTKSAGDVVKRWVNEVQEGLNSENVMVQYQAIGLMYHIKKSDRLAVTKLVTKLCRTPMKSPFAVYHLLRIICKLLEEETDSSIDNSLFDYVETCLRHKSETVVYEAACVVVNLRRTAARELAPAISVLQLFCSSPKSQLRFAAVRTLNKVAMAHPTAITTCNMDLENLISDSNRSVATLAITTLLKTGAESSVDRLMKQISSFVNEISDEFKIVVVQAIRALCEKYPRKHTVLMNFLSGMLREEGGLDYKAAIADTIITIIEDNPEAKDTGLAHLCEFIEDCEHNSLAVRILHLLGREGPKSHQPSRYIRFIYNRVLLECTVVRAAAVSTLGQFGASCPALLPHILVLLGRCQMDSDDEVRDRATYHYSILVKEVRDLNLRYILEPPQMSIPNLENALQQYIESPSTEKFDLRKVPVALISVLNKTSGGISIGPRPETIVTEKPVMSKEDRVLSVLSEVSEFLVVTGPCVKGTGPHPLTESETEYVVNLYKYAFAKHVIVRFEVMNTLNDQILKNVRVQFDIPEGFVILNELCIDKLCYNETASCWFLMEYPDNLLQSVGTSSATLKFIVIDCDPITGLPDSDEGYAEDYMVEDLEFTLCDQMVQVPKLNFLAAWDEVEHSFDQVQETYVLTSISTIEEAVSNITSYMGMCACERSDKVQPEKSSHTLFLSGKFRDGSEVLIQAKLAIKDGVSMQLTIRAENPDVPPLISSTIG